MPISRGVTRKFARSFSRAFARSAKNNIVPFFLERFFGALVAYSLRQLHPDALFAIRVRRSSDSQEMDIGFTPTGLLDESALLLFVGSGDGFVVIWYDQSGNNNHASQAVASEQPKIVNTGTVIKENGKPAIDWHKSEIILSTPSLTFNSHLDAFIATSARSAGHYITGRILQLASTFFDKNAFFEFTIESANSFFLVSQGDRGSISSTSNTLGHTLYSVDYNIPESEISVYKNTNLCAFRNDPDSSATITKDLQIGNWIAQDRNRTFDGVFQEIILYSSDQSTNRSNIEANINNHYLIY